MSVKICHKLSSVVWMTPITGLYQMHWPHRASLVSPHFFAYVNSRIKLNSFMGHLLMTIVCNDDGYYQRRIGLLYGLCIEEMGGGWYP